MWLTITYYSINPTLLANQPKKWDSQYDHPTIYIYPSKVRFPVPNKTQE